MAAIDLLFDVKKDLERLHQLVLGPLLIRTRLLEKLAIGGVPARENFQWEPQGRSFDLGVEISDPEGANVWVEMKVDGCLTARQVKRQVSAVKPIARDKLLYILLGHAQYTTNLPEINAILKERLPERYTVVTASELCGALEQADLLLGTAEHDRDVRDLATAYLNWLRVLQDRYRHFPRRAFRDWDGGDCFGFFAWCRDQLRIQDMGMGYVPNPSGGFRGAWWHWREVKFGNHELSIWLHFEFAPPGKNRLCVKVQVGGRASSCARMREEVAARVLRHRDCVSVGFRRPQRMGSGTSVTVAVVGLGLESAANTEEAITGIPEVLRRSAAIVDKVARSFMA